MNEKKGIRIVFIPGIVRPDNFTGKAVAVVADEIKKIRNNPFHLFLREVMYN